MYNWCDIHPVLYQIQSSMPFTYYCSKQENFTGIQVYPLWFFSNPRQIFSNEWLFLKAFCHNQGLLIGFLAVANKWAKYEENHIVYQQLSSFSNMVQIKRSVIAAWLLRLTEIESNYDQTLQNGNFRIKKIKLRCAGHTGWQRVIS